ncbi:histidine phosphatase family protein [Nocardia jiangxiensis]|uniref:Histidine phosphatase family protein n=1 Tax=Nocardia jiangxiensis TaxID=282685 RepID=A0ABW6SEZ9_9NOCA
MGIELIARLGLAARVAADLREVHLGSWESGLLRKMVAEGDPVARRMQAEERWDVIPGAEPAEEFATRVRKAVKRLAPANAWPCSPTAASSARRCRWPAALATNRRCSCTVPSRARTRVMVDWPDALALSIRLSR